MDKAEVIKILRNEQTCIKTADLCYRSCVECPLVMECKIIEAYDTAIEMLSEPERKTGKWIEDAETYYKAVNEEGGGVDENTPYFTEDYIACSECLTMFSVIDNCTEDFDFCPKCGARMVQEGEDNERA